MDACRRHVVLQRHVEHRFSGRNLAEEVLFVVAILTGSDGKDLACAFCVVACDDRGVDINKTLILEKFMRTQLDLRLVVWHHGWQTVGNDSRIHHVAVHHDAEIETEKALHDDLREVRIPHNANLSSQPMTNDTVTE